MNSIISAGKSVCKYFTVGILSLLMPVFLIACGGGPKHMITMDVKPPLAVKPHQAVLVIARTTSIGFAVTIENYLDSKMIGQTKGKSYFVTDVAPGQHYIMAHAENWATARMNFKAGRIYFLNQDIRMGVWMARTGFSPMTAEEGLKQVSESGCEYRAYNTRQPGEDMSARDFKEAKDDFEKEVKEGDHKDIVDYKGYSKL